MAMAVGKRPEAREESNVIEIPPILLADKKHRSANKKPLHTVLWVSAYMYIF